MVKTVDAEFGCLFIGEGPADVIVHADIIDPGTAGLDAKPLAHRIGQHAHLPRGQRIPQQRHQQRIVRELALGGADIFDHLIRVDDGFGFEQQARRGDAGQGIIGLDNHVRFGQVLRDACPTASR